MLLPVGVTIVRNASASVRCDCSSVILQGLLAVLLSDLIHRLVKAYHFESIYFGFVVSSNVAQLTMTTDGRDSGLWREKPALKNI